MKAATVRQYIKEAGTAAKVPSMHTNALRQYSAPNLLRAGVDMRKVQIHLGNANIQHADLYAPA